MMKKHFPEETKPAETRWVNNRHELVESKDPDLETLTYLQGGKMQGAYVPEHIATSVKRNPVEGMLIAEALRLTARPFKMVFTEMNPGFWLFNIFRDYRRAARNLPKAKYFNKWLVEYVKGIKPAFKSVYGIPDPIIKNMLKEKTLITVADFRGDIPEDVMMERLLKRYNVVPKKWETKVLKPFGQLWYHLQNISRGIERVPKVAGYQWMKTRFPDLSPEARAHIIRVRAGSPAFLHQGTASPIYNNLWLFSNAMKEGWRGDLAALKDNRAEFTYKVFKYNILPKIAMFAATLGLMGLGTKKMMDRISEYDKTNYQIIPLGMTPKGRVVYIRIPQDETGRFFGGIFWKAITRSGQPMQLADYMAGQAPTLHPMFAMAGAVKEYVAGRNPYDFFRGRNAMPQQVFDAGGKDRITAMLKYMSNQAGGGVIHRFGTDDRREIELQIEQLLKLPLFSNMLGRFLKISDYGLKEQFREEAQVLKQHKAKEALRAKEAFDLIISGESKKLSKEQWTAFLEKVKTMDSYMLKALAYRYGNTWTQLLLQAQSKEEKAIVIRMIAEDSAK
jgi:hypothetical protein